MITDLDELVVTGYGRLLILRGRHVTCLGWVPPVLQKRRRWWDKIHPKAKKYPERLRWDA